MSKQEIFKAREILTKEFYAEMKRQAEIEVEFEQTRKTSSQWATIRKIYNEMLPDIMESSRQDIRSMVEPYYVDWSKIFTPIEEDAWYSIRIRDIALYPQFPVLNCFIDFANPYLKIGVELDGKNYHDPVKDKARDERLQKEGWTIYRISGRECYVRFQHPAELKERGADIDEIEEAYRHWYLNTSDGVIESINQVYFIHGSKRRRLALESLKLHRLV